MRLGRKKRSNNYLNYEEDEKSEDSISMTEKRVSTVQLFLPGFSNQYRHLLYCDAPFDIRYFTNSTFYDQEYQRVQKKIMNFIDFKDKKIAMVEMESNYQQLKDCSLLLHQLRSLSSQEAYNMSIQLEKNYLLYKQQLKEINQLEKKGQEFHFDKSAMISKSNDIIQKLMKTESKYILFNIISMDFELKEMKKKYAGSSYEFGKILLNNKEQLITALMKLGNFNFGGDMINFTKHQFPECDEREVPVCVHTLDGFVVPCISKLVSIPLTENKFNILLVKLFKIDPEYIQRMTNIRKRMKTFDIQTLLSEDKYGDKNFINISHYNQEGILFEKFQYQQNLYKDQQQQQPGYQQINPYIQLQAQNQQQKQKQEIFSASEELNSMAEDDNLMSFEPPQFCEETKKSDENMIETKAYLQLQDNEYEKALQQDQGILKQFKNIIYQNKQEEEKFISTFYQQKVNY